MTHDIKHRVTRKIKNIIYPHIDEKMHKECQSGYRLLNLNPAPLGQAIPRERKRHHDFCNVTTCMETHFVNCYTCVDTRASANKTLGNCASEALKWTPGPALLFAVASVAALTKCSCSGNAAGLTLRRPRQVRLSALMRRVVGQKHEMLVQWACTCETVGGVDAAAVTDYVGAVFVVENADAAKAVKQTVVGRPARKRGRYNRW